MFLLPYLKAADFSREPFSANVADRSWCKPSKQTGAPFWEWKSSFLGSCTELLNSQIRTGTCNKKAADTVKISNVIFGILKRYLFSLIRLYDDA